MSIVTANLLAYLGVQSAPGVRGKSFRNKNNYQAANQLSYSLANF